MEFRKSCLGDLEQAEGRCLIIGEVAQTHDGSLGLAHSFVDAIARAGADAVKFQTHIAAAESTHQEPWRVKFSPYDETRYEYWERMEWKKEEWAGLKKHAEECGLLFMSSPFSIEAFELLQDIGMRVWKVASGEISNPMLLDRIISTGEPVILSSGMSDMEELRSAVNKIKKKSNPLAVLQCTSAYPCPPEKIGLNILEMLKNEFGCPVGLSDHSGNMYSGIAAAALGAEVLEIHVTLSREMFGPDVPASITTKELSQLTEGVRWIEKIIQNPVDKESIASEFDPLREIFTKSIYAGSDLKAGTTLSEANIQLKKPGNGVSASRIDELIGKRLLRDIAEDELILIEDLKNVDNSKLTSNQN